MASTTVTRAIWAVAYSGTAVSSAPAGRRITAPSEVGQNLRTGDPDDLVLCFGTGRHIANGDYKQTDQTTQTFYGIFVDRIATPGSPPTLATPSPDLARSELLQQFVLQQASANSLNTRITPQLPLNLVTHNGW